MNVVLKINIFNVVLINARTLRTKLESFKDTLNELGADVCLITETWFKHKDQIKAELEDFKNKNRYDFIRKDR